MMLNLQKFKKSDKYDRKIEYILSHAITDLIKENKIKVRLYDSKEKWIGITNPGDEKAASKQLEKSAE
jgi:hypothetical protein